MFELRLSVSLKHTLTLSPLSLSPLSLLCHSTSISLTPVVLSVSLLSSSPANSFLSFTAVFSFFLSFCIFIFRSIPPAFFFIYCSSLVSFSNFPLLNLLIVFFFLYVLTPCFIFSICFPFTPLQISLSLALSLSLSLLYVYAHTPTHTFFSAIDKHLIEYLLYYIFSVTFVFVFLFLMFCSVSVSLSIYFPLSLSNTHTHTHTHTHIHSCM